MYRPDFVKVLILRDIRPEKLFELGREIDRVGPVVGRCDPDLFAKSYHGSRHDRCCRTRAHGDNGSRRTASSNIQCWRHECTDHASSIPAVCHRHDVGAISYR